MGKSTISMAMFNSYVRLPEGIQYILWKSLFSEWIKHSPSSRLSQIEKNQPQTNQHSKIAISLIFTMKIRLTELVNDACFTSTDSTVWSPWCFLSEIWTPSHVPSMFHPNIPINSLLFFITIHHFWMFLNPMKTPKSSSWKIPLEK